MKIIFLDKMTLGDVDLSEFGHFGEVVLFDTTMHNERIDRVKSADVIVVNKVQVDRGLVDSAPSLKLVLASSTGVNNIDLELCKSRDIAVANVPGYSTASVVAHTFALYFYLAHHLDYYIDFGQKSWHNAPIFTELSRSFGELAGKEWGIVGMGAIGQAVAKVATAFGANVSYFSTSGANTNQPYPSCSLIDLMSRSDVISIHAPLNQHTLDLITKKELDLMKAGAILLNLGRGGIVNELDLAQKLSQHTIKAGLDVLAKEPPAKDNPLFSVENIAITPHVAWASIEARNRLVDEMILNLKAFINGVKRNRIV